MWIAFKNYYLRDEEQLSRNVSTGTSRCELLSKIIIFETKNNTGPAFLDPYACCELLSKIIIFETKNNFNPEDKWVDYVVNCFQKLLSSRRRTTPKLCSTITWLLWIAFKNYYLRDEEQHRAKTLLSYYSCELLSKIIIFETKNNLKK